MSADFYASYASGAIGICIGNRLDIIKTELQAGNRIFTSNLAANSPVVSLDGQTARTYASRLQSFTSLFRGAAAPILGYSALNSILFLTYNRTLKGLDPSIPDPTKLAGVRLDHIWVAGAIGGLACWVVSAPSELIKCRTQLRVDGASSSYATAKDVYRRHGIRGFYLGGTITSMRDSFGYAWYFWTYELTKRMLLSRGADPFADPRAADILIAGGVAGVVTWASVFPLDVIKTRIQTQSFGENEALLGQGHSLQQKSAWQVARDVARVEGMTGLYKGLGVCSLRAFIVNAVQVSIALH